jgi:large subunit ribosomal protein L7e
VKEYRDAEREKIRLSRVAKQEGSYYVPAEAKLVFVVRIKGYVNFSMVQTQC